MSIISTIGRKSLKVRCLIWSIYLVLTLGALTMIYPFWLMISGTGKSSTDVSELKLIPAYLVDDAAYYRKTVASLFNEYVVYEKICRFVLQAVNGKGVCSAGEGKAGQPHHVHW